MTFTIVNCQADIRGADSFIIAAADTVMRQPSRELMAEVFPDVPIRGEVNGNATLGRFIR